MCQFSDKKLLPTRAHQHTYLSLCLFSIVSATVCTTAYAENKNVTQLNTITVYAEHEDAIPASVKKIDRDNLDKTGATDMASIVKYLPLVSAPFSTNGSSTFYAGTGTSSYNIRGIDGNRVGLDVDGIDIADSTVAAWTGASMRQSAAGRDYIDPEMFQTVNITSGTTNVSTDGIGGRVSFKNKSPEDYLIDGKTIAGNLKNGYSSANQAWFSSVTGAVGNDTVKALIAYAHRDGQETKSNSKTKAFPTDWDSDAILGQFIWQPNAQNKFNITFDYYQKNSNIINIDNSAYSAIVYNDGKQDQDIERKLFSLGYTYTPENFALFDRLDSKLWYQVSDNKTQTSYTMVSRNTDVFRDFSNAYRQKDSGLKLDASKTVGIHQILYGLTADQKNYSSNRTDLRNGALSSTLYQGNYLFDSKVNRYAMYVSDAIQFDVLDKQLIATPSLRLQRQEYKPENSTAPEIIKTNYNYITPAFSVSYQLTPANYTYAKYTRGVRVPTATELGGYFQTGPNASYYLSGNTALKKESSDGFEIGLKNNTIDGLNFDITAFYTKYHDFIDYQLYLGQGNCAVDIASQCYVAENIADAAIWGGEISTRLDLSKFINHADGLSVGFVAGATNGNAKNKDGSKSGINTIQPAKASLTFAYDHPEHIFGIGLTATAVDNKMASLDVSTFQNGTTSYYPVAGYTLFDLSTYWNINKFSKLNVALNNIFDKTYWNYSAVGTLTEPRTIDRSAEAGRNVVASLEFKF